MVRTLGTDETLAKDGSDAATDERVRPPAPTADELHELVHGPRRPVRWMRWLAGAVLIVAGAAIAGIMLADDRAQVDGFDPDIVSRGPNADLAPYWLATETVVPDVATRGPNADLAPYWTATETVDPTVTRGPNADLAPYWPSDD